MRADCRWLLGLALAAVAPAQEATTATTAPGLVLRLGVPDAVPIDARVARTLALYVGADELPSPLFDAAGGSLQAEWVGEVLVEVRDRYAFSFAGLGRFSLEIDGATVLEADGDARAQPVVGASKRLRPGRYSLRAVYRSVAGQAAEVRVGWQARRFAPEPLSPLVVRHDPNDELLRRGQRLRAGRSAVAAAGCANCHAVPDGVDLSASMPELGRKGPALDGIGSRLNLSLIHI